MIGGASDDRLVGGSGTDTAVFSGASADYNIFVNGRGYVIVEDLAGTDGRDVLIGMEFIEFTDTTIDASGIV